MKWDIWKRPGPSPPAFYIRESPGKSLGMFADRPVNTGELIIIKQPVVVTRTVLGIAPEQELDNHCAALRPTARFTRLYHVS